ncbi:MAG TPA: 50S ribosomal protein L32 [Bacteroidetes bacterium]|nr:50S ribosomal protein L32 [Bacteroidota bacterium]
MANPRTRTSKRRKRARRTHYKATVPNVVTCKKTGEPHLMHRAYYDDEGNLLYKGRILVKAEEEDF